MQCLTHHNQKKSLHWSEGEKQPNVKQTPPPKKPHSPAKKPKQKKPNETPKQKEKKREDMFIEKIQLFLFFLAP